MIVRHEVQPRRRETWTVTAQPLDWTALQFPWTTVEWADDEPEAQEIAARLCGRFNQDLYRVEIRHTLFELVDDPDAETIIAT